VGCERRVIPCITRGEIIDAESAFLERKRATQHRWIASTAGSRSSVESKLTHIHVLAYGGCQASSDGIENTPSRISDGY
jgi:hypothetical protein